MEQLRLYAFPGACSQVVICALEQIREAATVDYTIEWVDLLAGVHLKSEYAQLIPSKKVPALFVGERLLVENAAIQFYLNQQFPEAGLLPSAEDALDAAQQVSALAFCSGTLHPITRSIANPARLTSGDIEAVREKGKETAQTAFGLANRRIAEYGWWFGRESIVDVYVNWAYRTALRGELDTSLYPALNELHQRLVARPTYGRTLEIEAQGRATLGL